MAGKSNNPDRHSINNQAGCAETCAVGNFSEHAKIAERTKSSIFASTCNAQNIEDILTQHVPDPERDFR